MATRNAQDEAPEAAGSAPAPGLVLLVDDEPLMLRSLRRILEAAGHRTALAGSWEEARPWMADPGLDVVLLDLFLGPASGLDVLERLRREAARQRRTMSELVESALRLLFQMRRERPELPPLPSFASGGALVEVADRQALYEAMEGR